MIAYTIPSYREGSGMNSAMRRQIEEAQKRDTVQNIIAEVIGWSVTGLMAIAGAYSWYWVVTLALGMQP